MPHANVAHPSRWQAAAPRALSLVQGAFYVLTGLWPILHAPSFLAVTGPKVDVWLVQTVGALLAVTGAALFAAGWRRRLQVEWAALAAGQAAALAAVDVIFVSRGRISPIYLADAVAEVALVVAWAWLALRRVRG